MIDQNEPEGPTTWQAIRTASVAAGFDMPSEPRTGSMLRFLASTKPGGRLLEIGTGTGLATAFLLDGMDRNARLVTVDTDPKSQAIARHVLAHDERVEFVLDDGLAFLHRQPPASFDLVFADAWPGKYEGLDLALGLLTQGGIFVGDDMAPQPNWPPGHEGNVDRLLQRVGQDDSLATVTMNWASGLVLATRRR
jgi:predicted O-methyltransferase YrrM